MGNRLSSARGFLEALTPSHVRCRLYLIALERGFLDSILDRLVVEPFMQLARQLARVDRWLCDAVLPSGRPATIEAGKDLDE